MNGGEIFKFSKGRYSTTHPENATIRKRISKKTQPTYLEAANSKISDKFRKPILLEPLPMTMPNAWTEWIFSKGSNSAIPHTANTTIRKRKKKKTQSTYLGTAESRISDKFQEPIFFEAPPNTMPNEWTERIFSNVPNCWWTRFVSFLCF